MVSSICHGAEDLEGISAAAVTYTGRDGTEYPETGTAPTNAGSYTASFTPTRNYKWSDGTTNAKTAGWSIGKAAGSLALVALPMVHGTSFSSADLSPQVYPSFGVM